VQETGTERNNSVSFAVFDTNKHVKQAVRMLFSTNHCREQQQLRLLLMCLQTRIQYQGHQAPFTNTESDCIQGSSSAHLPANFTSETRKRIVVTFGTGTTVKRSVRYGLILIRVIHFSKGLSHTPSIFSTTAHYTSMKYGFYYTYL
jgi:hypothetical protein